MTAGDDVGAPRRRLRHRIPISVRRHWRWPAALMAFAVVVIVTMGSMTIRPIITGDERVISSSITDNIEGTVDLFDDSVQHEFQVKITDADYSEMVDAFVDNGEKKWVTADVVIDGTVVKDVGVRLKGNSTLMSLRGGMQMPDGMEPPEGMEPPDGVQLPEGLTMPGAEQKGGKAGRGGKNGQMPGGFGGMTSLSVDDPTSLPLLISFDKDVEGRAYQGLTQLSVRPGSPVVNEAMALSLTAATDQPTQRYAYTVYSVNDSKTATRILLEYPDADYADSLFDTNGYLYKADASSKFEYVDGDQSSYSDQFKQINSEGNGNLQPIIKFLKWLKDADDAEFDAHLADWVDVDSFAKYLGTQNLLSNMDDMSGPGQNYYLWYDLDTKRISVISWDLNLAMQGDTSAGPHDAISMGQGMGGAPGGPQKSPGNGRGDLPAMPQRAAMKGGDHKPGNMRGGNELKERFMKSKKFVQVYDTGYWTLYDQVYGNGTAKQTLERLSSTIPLSDGLTQDKLDAAVQSMSDWIGQRGEALAAVRKG